MDEKMKIYETKLQKMLEEFLKPDYKFANDSYLEILLSHLSGKNNAKFGQDLIQLPLFTEWIDKAICTWEKTSQMPSHSIQTFIFHLCSFISKCELNFLKLDIQDIFTRLISVLKINSNNTTPSVKLAYVKMLSSFLLHKTGHKWIIKTERWKDVIQYCRENNTVYVTREGYNFIFELLSKFIEENEEFCRSVITEIATPLVAKPLQNENNILLKNDTETLQKSLTSTVVLIGHILDSCHKSDNQLCREKIPQMFADLDIETSVWNIVNTTNDHQFQMPITKVLILLYFHTLEKSKNESASIGFEDFKVFGIKLFTLFTLLIGKDNIKVFLTATHLSHVYWIKMNQRVQAVLECNKSSKRLVFENQMIIFHIIPIIFTLHPTKFIDERTDEFLEMYVNKLFEISCEHTTRIAYQFRNAFYKQGKLNETAKQAVHMIMQTRKYLHRERAVIVFQALMYVLKSTSVALHAGSLHTELLAEDSGILSAVLHGLASLIMDFHITWHESVETICLMTFAMDLLSSNNLSSRLTVQALQLIQLSIENFMPPNLALLVDSIDGSSMRNLGPILLRRLHDPHWEVRDSALEVLHTITTISECKFLAFQDLIAETQLCQLTVTLAMKDSESYVRASAIKCITAMIKIDLLWSEYLYCQELTEKMISVLHTETEGIVRKEAAALIKEIYEHQKINPAMLESVYNIMASAAILDLHWEVKVNALKFWEKVIERQLSDQGMIDGLFPSVTFSKEHRKIVSLNTCEIMSRLMKVLTQLANNACLGVLLTGLHDDCDLTVVQTAAEILTRLTNMLSKYNMLDENRFSYCQATTAVWDTTTWNNKPMLPEKTSTITIEESNKVIEGIVNLDDVNLLSLCYRNQMKVENDHLETGEKMRTCDKLNHLKSVTPEAFIGYLTNKNIKNLVEERTQWLKHSSDDLDSVLDDILQSYELNEINGMDCY